MPDANQISPVNDGDYGVVILAAGASRRMGSLKGLLKWGERSVLGQVYHVWRKAGAVQVAVVYDPAHARMIEEMDRIGLTGRIANEEAELGMMSSLRAASAWDGWKSGLTGMAVALIDQPQVTIDMARKLMAFANVPENEGGICQPKHREKRGHPVMFPWGDFCMINEAKAATLKEFIRQRAERRRFMEVDDAALLEDMDMPEDYERILGSFSGRIEQA